MKLYRAEFLLKVDFDVQNHELSRDKIFEMFFRLSEFLDFIKTLSKSLTKKAREIASKVLAKVAEIMQEEDNKVGIVNAFEQTIMPDGTTIVLFFCHGTFVFGLSRTTGYHCMHTQLQNHLDKHATSLLPKPLEKEERPILCKNACGATWKHTNLKSYRKHHLVCWYNRTRLLQTFFLFSLALFQLAVRSLLLTIA